MTDHLLKRALARKASTVSLNVFSENAGALSLYQSLGFLAAKRPVDESESPSVYLEYDH
jgi:ribosomal protein S18 acetylase RimI-like enzyme